MNITVRLSQMGLSYTEKQEVLHWVDAKSADIQEATYEKLFSYYSSHGMPYGVAKARSGDPFEWIRNQLIEDAVTTWLH